jgi:Phage tail tube protein, TTP
MAFQIPNGASLSIASVIASALNVTIATNASSCVLTVTNALSAGSYVEFVSGWALATNRIYRLSAATGTTVTLEGLDTTSTSLFPVGAGLGTIRAITTWTPILQVMDFDTEGGEAKNITVQFLENKSETEVITGSTAPAYVFNLADDITLAGYVALKGYSDSGAQTGFRFIAPSGAVTVAAVKAFVNQNAKIQIDNLMTVSARLPLQNLSTRYAS